MVWQQKNDLNFRTLDIDLRTAQTGAPLISKRDSKERALICLVLLVSSLGAKRLVVYSI